VNVKQKGLLVFLVLTISVLFAVGFISVFIVPEALHPGNGSGLPVYYDSLPSAPVLSNIQPDPDFDVSISLDWSDSSNVWYYNVYRRKSGDEEKTVALARTSSSFIDGASKEDGLYYYRIEAVNNVGKVMSNTETVTIEVPVPPPPPPPPPVIPEAPILENIIPNPNINGEINLQWDSVSGATVYTIYRSKDGGSLETLEENFEVNSYTDSVSENGVYSYQVKAGNSEGYSGYSNEGSVTVQLTNIPPNPIMNQITYEIIDEIVEVYLDWNEVICESYNVYRSINYGDYVLIEENTFSTSYFEVLTETGIVSYRVSAVNQHGESGLSNPMSINISPEDEPPADYIALYALLGILVVLVGATVILLRMRKKR